MKRRAHVGDLGYINEENMEDINGIVFHVGRNDVGRQTEVGAFERMLVDFVNLWKSSQKYLFLSNKLP